MSSEIHKKIRKLEVRLEDYIEADQKFVDRIKKGIKALQDLNENLETGETSRIEDLRRKAVQALGDILQKEGHIQHEKSHLWESYGDLIQSIEQKIQEGR
ncbi:MAG: hypothetical protein ACOC6H_02305 [Thermoproteota archaeon]